MNAEEHKIMFQDFYVCETLSAGPDPTARVAVEIAKRMRNAKAGYWYCVLYGSTMVNPTAEVMMNYWPTPDAVLSDDFTKWVARNFTKLPLAVERRSLQHAGRYAEHVKDAAAWLLGGGVDDILGATSNQVFRSVTSIKNNGRYAGLKLWEVLHGADPRISKLYGVQPKGAVSVRTALSWMFPAYREFLLGSDRPSHLEMANELAWQILDATPKADWFKIEAALCGYKQANYNHWYAGATLDSELGRLLRLKEDWPSVGFTTPLVRKSLIPVEHLGEVQGWSRRRSELSGTIPRYGYAWSDVRYDYNKTKDLGHLVRREL